MSVYSAIKTGALAVGIGFLVWPGSSAAGPPLEDALRAARHDIEQGRCEQAERRLSDIGGLENRARLLAGQCRIRAGLYLEALDGLDRIRGADDLGRERVGDVELYRAIALYHLERYTEAAAALDAADGLTQEEAQFALYRGLIALREGDNDRAAPDLESAGRLSPALKEPVASYFAGLAWQGAAERTRAREAFERVVAIDGDGAWGKEAKKLLESIELFPYFIRGSVGMEWDDNVLLRGDVTQIVDDNPLTIAGEDDWRGVWEFDAGVQLWQSDDGNRSAGATASYYGNAHIDLKDVNTHYPTIGVYLVNRFDAQTIGQVRYQFGYAWVNENPYLQTHTGEVSLSHTWTRAGTTIALADILVNDLRFEPNEVTDQSAAPAAPPACDPVSTASCSPFGVNENRERERDGYGFGGAVEHRYLMPVPDWIDEIVEEIQVGGGYRFRFYDSEGEEWEHFAHVFSVSMAVELPLDFSLVTRLSYERRDFLNPSTFPDVEANGQEYSLSGSDRKEDEVVFEAEVEKDITENWSVSARYSYLDNDSNRDAYNYDRHVVGGFLNFRFD